MAREVYADPFGSYIQGYDTGAQRQMQQEQNVRAARDVDWNFYNMKPIELETAQRNNAFQAYADPYQRQMLPIGVDRARTGLFTDQFNAAMPLSYLGLTQPAAAAINQYTGMPYTHSDQGVQFYGPNGAGPVGPTINPQGFQEVYPQMREEAYKRGQDEWMRAYQIEAQRREAESTAAYVESVRAQVQAQAAKANPGVTGYGFGTPMHNWLWGGQAQSAQPAPVAAPNYLAPYLPQAR